MHSVHSTQPKQHPLDAIVSTTTVLGYINVMLKDIPFFNSYGDEVNESWNAFENKFPGVTCDWSDALGTSFNEVLFEHATTTLGQLSIQREDIHSYSRKCDVHFLWSVTHIAQMEIVFLQRRKGNSDIWCTK